MKVTEDMIGCLTETLNTISCELEEAAEAEDFESKEDLLNSVINNIRHDFGEYEF